MPPTAAALHAEFLKLIDGDYAGSLSDVRCALAPSSLTKIMALANADVRAFLFDILKAQGLSCDSSTHVKRGAIAAGDVYAYASKGNGRDGAAVAAVWPSMQLIRDPYSAANKGQVSLDGNQPMGLRHYTGPRTSPSWSLKW